MEAADQSELGAGAFSLKSALLSEQEEWRRQQLPSKVNIEGVLDRQDMVLQLLLLEDEIDRVRSTDFILLHPLKASALHYLSLYRSPRFSDHLLTRWIFAGGSAGKYSKHIAAYLNTPTAPTRQNNVATVQNGLSMSSYVSKMSINETTSVGNKLKQPLADRQGLPFQRRATLGGGLPILAKKVGKRSRSTPATASRLVMPTIVVPSFKPSHRDA
jgi:hypothetical protein